MKQFFLTHWNLSMQSYNNKESIAVNKVSVQCMLNVVHFVRVQKNVRNSRCVVRLHFSVHTYYFSNFRKIQELTLNYLHVAQAAQFCTAHFTALLYVELWSQERIRELISHNVLFSVSGLTPLDIIIQNEESSIQQAVRNILREVFDSKQQTWVLKTLILELQKSRRIGCFTFLRNDWKFEQ